MKFKLENQDGVYYLDVYYIDTLKENVCYTYGTVIFDTKRKEKKYYLIPSENSNLSETFIEIMENLFIASLAPKDDNGYSKFKRGSRSGELAYDVKKKLVNLFKLYEIDMPNLSELESDESDEKYYHLLHEYNVGYYPENKILK